MNKLLTLLLLIPIVTNAVCLGIFEDKIICEYKKELKKATQICREKSWIECKYLYEGQYVPNCYDRVRVKCLSELGFEGIEDR